MHARYQHYNEEAKRNGSLQGDTGFAIFRLWDCDDSILTDFEVVAWAEEQGQPIQVDYHVWTHPATWSKHGLDYPFAIVVDAFDSAVLMIRDPELALAFKMKFC